MDNDLFIQTFHTIMSRDFANLFLGRLIGKGMSRQVFEHAFDDSLVIKMEAMEPSGRFQNVEEWETWRRMKECNHVARWLAPCVAISPCGRWLVQKRTTPLAAAHLPTRIPIFFTDLKAANWGEYEGRPVCHDYGMHLMHSVGTPNRTKKVAIT